MDSKAKYFVILFAALIFSTPFPAFANRGMLNMGPKEVTIQEPAQNAIVAWNGHEEVIILSTDILSSKPTLVLEVLPLPANPEKVEAGTFDSFKKLTAKVNEEIRAIRAKGIPGRGSGAGADVEITFHEQIGAHDITVVKVGEVDSFMRWVKEFAVGKELKFSRMSPKFKDAVSKYLDKGIRYFVFDVIETGKDRESIQPLLYRFNTDFLYYPLDITATSDAGGSDSKINLFFITKGFMDKALFKIVGLRPRAGFEHGIILGKADLAKVNRDLADLFTSDAYVMNAVYHGSLSRLNTDLVVRNVFRDREPIRRAKELFEKGLDAERLSDKESFYAKALKLWPEYAQAHNNLGDVYEKQGRYQAAIKEYRIASALAPNVSFPYLGLGDAYFKLGEFHQAITFYEKGLAIDPQDKLSKGRSRLSRILTTKILFPFDSCRLTDKAVKQLEVIAEALSSPEFEETVFEIQGHTDSTGPEGYNLKLSSRRAEQVRKYLVEKGEVPASKLIAKGYGEDRPITSNETKEGRQRNRRVEINKFLNRKD